MSFCMNKVGPILIQQGKKYMLEEDREPYANLDITPPIYLGDFLKTDLKGGKWVVFLCLN